MPESDDVRERKSTIPTIRTREAIRQIWEFYYLEHRKVLIVIIVLTGFGIAMLRTSQGMRDGNLTDNNLPPDRSYHGLDHPYLLVGNLPYGIIWYAMVEPLYWFSFRQPLVLTILMYALNAVVASIVAQKNFTVFLYYVAVSNITGQDNWNSILQTNLPIAWLSLLGLWQPIFLLVAVLAKLPLGSEPFLGLADWQFAFGSAGVVYNGPQIRQYASFGIVWLMVLDSQIRRHILRLVKWLCEFPGFIGKKLDSFYNREVESEGWVPPMKRPVYQMGSGCPRCGAQDWRRMLGKSWVCGSCGYVRR